MKPQTKTYKHVIDLYFESVPHSIRTFSVHGNTLIYIEYYCCPIKILRSYKIRADFICEVSPFSLDFSRQTIKSNHGQKYTF